MRSLRGISAPRLPDFQDSTCIWQESGEPANKGPVPKKHGPFYLVIFGLQDSKRGFRGPKSHIGEFLLEKNLEVT